MASKAASINVICRTEVPLERTLGPEVGAYIKSLHESKGVQFVINAEVTAFSSASGAQEDDNVQYVHLTKVSGETSVLSADLVVMGIGVYPATNYLQDCNVQMDEQGHVVTNEFMQSSVGNIFAAGDIAKFPLDLPTIKTNVAIGHWQMAHSHGRIAGLNISQERKQSLKTVPFFWTVQFGQSLRYAGFAPKYDDIIYEVRNYDF